jgi:hypothetical protein
MHDGPSPIPEIVISLIGLSGLQSRRFVSLRVGIVSIEEEAFKSGCLEEHSVRYSFSPRLETLSQAP